MSGTDQPRRAADREPQFHTPADENLTRLMVQRAPAWMAGTAGIARVLLKDSVQAILAISAVIITLNQINQGNLERQHRELVEVSEEQIDVTKTLAGDVAGLRGDLTTGLASVRAEVQAGLGEVRGEVSEIKNRVVRLEQRTGVTAHRLRT